MVTYTRTPRLIVRYGSSVGAAPDTVLANVLSASITLGVDQRVSTASVVFPGPIIGTGIDYWSAIEIAVDAGSWAPAAPPVRFVGLVAPDGFSYQMAPRTVTLKCVGKLTKIDRVIPALDSDNPDTPGISLAGFTDSQLVGYLLAASGLSPTSSPPEWYVADIGGTRHALGTETAAGSKGSKSQFVWERKQSARSFLERLEAVTMGFKTFETLGGRIVRRQVAKRPSLAAITGDLRFTEGVDLFTATALHSVGDTANRVTLTGFDDGTKPLRYSNTVPHPHPMPGVPFVTYSVDSRFVERKLLGDSGQGLIAQEIVDGWLLIEKATERLEGEFTTFKDALIGPGDTIALVSPKLETAQNYWVQSVTITADEQGFTQSLKVSAPAAVGAGGSALPMELGIYGFIGLGPGLGSAA